MYNLYISKNKCLFCSKRVENTFGKEKNCTLRVISAFSHSAFKGLVLPVIGKDFFSMRHCLLLLKTYDTFPEVMRHFSK